MSSNPEGSKASSKTAAGNSTSPGFLEKIDRYGYIPQLMYGGDTACKSQFGGFLTFGAGLCYVFLVCFTVYRYFERKSPSTSLNRVFRQDPEGFSITETSMPFAFGIQNPNYEHFIDETVYKVDAFYTESIKTVGKDGTLSTEYKKTKLNLIPCSQVSLDPIYFSNLELKSMFCLENFASKKLDLKISGRFESNYFSRIDIAFKRCKGTGCKSNTEIDKLLRDSYFAINYKDRVAELTQFESPVNQFPTSIFTSCSTDYLKYLHMYMADNTIITDSSLVGYMELDRIRFPSTGTYKTDFSSLVRSGEDYPDVFFNLVLRMDPIENIYNRKYNNIYNYLAEFGGLTQVIILSVFLLTFRFRYVYLNFDLAKKFLEKNKLYHYILKKRFEDTDVVQVKENSSKPEFGSQNKSPNKVAPTPSVQSRFSWGINPISLPRQKSIKKKFAQARDSEPDLEKQGMQSARKIEMATDPSKTQSGGEVRLVSIKRVEFNLPLSETARTNNGWDQGSDSNDSSPPKVKTLQVTHTGIVRSRDVEAPGSERSVLAKDSPSAIPNTDEFSQDIRSPSGEHSSLRKFHKDFEEYNNVRNTSKAVGFWDFLMACLFPCATKTTKLDRLSGKSQENTYFNFDILKMARVIEEMDKLKSFLFSPEQAVLYDLLPRAHLRYIPQQKRFTFVDTSQLEGSLGQESKSDDISGMYDFIRQAFQSVKTAGEHSEIDKKLVAAFDKLIIIKEGGQ